MRLRPALVLALDGATFDVIRPLTRAGRLPHLARWMQEGCSAPLRSTTPPMTFPAWSSFMTGLGPGRHGIFDFSHKLPGAYRIRFTNAADRRGASLFSRVSRAGGRVLVLGMPATFPPEPVSGLLVSGFDAPVSTGTDERSASDPALYRRVAAAAGPWMRPDLDEGARGDFHERAVDTLLARVDRKTGFALEALRRLAETGGGRPDLAVVVFSESDTVGHHYWRDHDPASPRHDPAASARRKGAVAAVYERLDAACGELRRAFGEDALCLVVSDHGMGGAAPRVVHPNRRLAECGLLTRAAGTVRDRLARSARDLALRALPPRVAQAAFRRARSVAARVESAARFAGCDWRSTAAFSEEANTLPGVWINLRGREAEGSVPPADYERARDEVIGALLDWKLPGGDPVVAWARRREEAYAGPCVERAPDLVFELALDGGYGLSLVPTPWGESAGRSSVRTLEAGDLAGGRGRGMNGTHRRDGVLIASGPGAPRALGAAPSIEDVAPTLADAMGLPAAGEDFDGAPLVPAPHLYTAEEEALVAARLTALGYLE
jgi:predicted AlkP superfamily phosphohydrolase/phosphomutase